VTAGFTGLSFRVWEVQRGSHWQDKTPSPWTSGKYPFGKYLTRALEALTTLKSWCCSERLKAKSEGSTRLVYTGLRWGLEHLKIETRLRDGRFESVKGECVI
jgi:hypothetical protein